ncbi:MAG: cytochrome C peroxidase [Bacteroidetes bacterium]|nr:cytochrome C peroxidase [Bacteroidota bacterium]
MRHLHTAGLLLVPFALVFCFSFFRYDSGSPGETCKQLASYETASICRELSLSIRLLDSVPEEKRLPLLKASYNRARKAYKHIECYIEYVSAFDAKYFINGPLVKKSELEYGKKVFDPHGFQVIEQLLYSTDSMDATALQQELVLLKEVFQAFRQKNYKLQDSQVFEMVQLELIRIMSLGLNGYDATFSKSNVNECCWALDGCCNFLKTLNPDLNPEAAKNLKTLQAAVSKAKSYALSHPDYNSFNRLYFITRYLKPVYTGLVTLHESSGISYTPVNYAVNLRATSFSGSAAFNLDYFSVSTTHTSNLAKQAELGKLLFFDPVLSGNNKRACASCHKPEAGFTDGLEKAVGFEHHEILARNTPTLLNAMLQKNFFADGRARHAEQQVSDVIGNVHEMNGNIEELISKLNQSEEYAARFKVAYKGTADTSISYYGILKAIFEYEKTLMSFNSRFDRYLNGEYNQLNDEEIRGYNIFAGKALCGSCHFFPLFNGLVPPAYNDTEYEVIGVPDKKNSKTIDPDEGRIAISKAEIHRYAFKTPTVRNIALTGPYMHNGVYKTLDEVIDFYNKGGGQGLGMELPNQTLPFDSLQLSKQDIRDLKSFMKSLTDTSHLCNKPAYLPSFKDEALNKRVIGGEY